ncbi:MAG: PEP-CTERM sorting domain-containing protein [Verrucomicrobiota bacterium]
MKRTLAAIFSLLASASISHAMIVADSVIDWNAARNDGLRTFSAPVTPGDPLDEAQQGHADSTDSGNWFYGFGSNSAGELFGGGIGQLEVWYPGSGWGRNFTGSAVVGVTGLAPLGSPPSINLVSNRSWESQGDFAGQTLYAIMTYTVGGSTLDGVTVSLANPGFNQLVTVHGPADAGQTFEKILAFTDSENAKIVAGLGPNNNFNNDNIQMSLVISTVIPEPSTALPLGVVILALVLLRRRRTSAL